MFRAFQIFALLTLLCASSGRAAAAMSQAPATSSPATALESAGANEDAPPEGLESRIGLLCHNDPVNRADPEGLTTWIVIDTSGMFGAHVALVTENSTGRFMYDPGGAYKPNPKAWKSSGNTWFDRDVSLSKLISQQRDGGKNDVSVYKYNTSETEEKKIQENAEKDGGRMGGFCAQGVSAALVGVDSFSKVGNKYTPNGIRDALEKQATFEEKTVYEKKKQGWKSAGRPNLWDPY